MIEDRARYRTCKICISPCILIFRRPRESRDFQATSTRLLHSPPSFSNLVYLSLLSSPLRPTREPRFKVSARGSLRRRLVRSLSLSLPPRFLASAKPRDCTLHHCTVGPLASRYRRRHTARAEKRRANSFFARPSPPTRFIARRTGHRVAIFLSNFVGGGGGG